MVCPSTTLAPAQPLTSTHGWVEEETIQRFEHSHPFYKADNATLYAHLGIATLGSQYASTIAPFKTAKNSSVPINASKDQFSGAAHWYK